MRTMKHLLIPCAPGEVSDGYHTFDELYSHRNTLFIALMSLRPSKSWVSIVGDDGKGEPGWFYAGMELPEGPVSYHLPDNLWGIALCTGCKTLDKAPPWDGHTAEDVLGRLVRTVTGPYQTKGPIRSIPEAQSAEIRVDAVGDP
jgi:hypothetical protein